MYMYEMKYINIFYLFLIVYYSMHKIMQALAIPLVDL